MYQLLLKLILISSLIQFGISLNDYLFCNSKACASRVEKASREVLKIDWKPISIFPEEARRFR